MLPACTTMAGMCQAMPDVCKVPAPPAPPIPVPFPNIAQCALGVATTMKVMIMNRPAIVQTSKIPISNGDEAGVAGGVVSGMIIGEVQFKIASTKVKFEGKSAVTLTAMTTHNGASANAVGVHCVPSQVQVLVAP
jgi:hypothetical protein